jgi:hypothetical protein
MRGDGDADNPDDIDGDERLDRDRDNDNKTPESYAYHDKDDVSALAFGREADVGETEAVRAVVTRYYAAASAHDAPAACSLLNANLARSLPEIYGQGAGPQYLRGARTCPAIVSRIFKRFQEVLSGKATVTGVRIKGMQAQAFVGSKTMPASEIALEREGPSWKIDMLMAVPFH